jgi:TonB family protein
MMRQSGTASVAFDYRGGTLVGDAAIVRSSGAAMLDSAALAAVRQARYPPPPGDSGQLFPLLVRVEADCG